MNKKGDFQLSPIVKAIIVLLVVVVVIFIWNSTAFAGIRAMLGFKIPGEDQQIEPLTNYDFYNTFIKEYKLCKLSPLKECKCKITPLENRLPAGYAIELVKSSGDTEISLVKFSLEYKENKCQFSSKEEDAAAETAIIANDALFTIEGKLKGIIFTEKSKISILAIRKGSGCSLEGLLLRDYAIGDQSNVMPAGLFSNHIYKQSKTEMYFMSKDQLDYMSRKWEKIAECKAPQNAEEANEKFEDFIKEINDFNSGSESTKTVKLKLPEHYKLRQTGIYLSLYWSNDELTKTATSLCSTDRDIANGNYALTKDYLDPRSPCVLIQSQNP